jgi:hypothetical protein
LGVSSIPPFSPGFRECAMLEVSFRKGNSRRLDE